MTGTEPFKPFIEQYCFEHSSDIILERVYGNPAPGARTTYRLTVYANGFSEFVKLMEVCKLFYGNLGIRFGYAYEMGMQGVPCYIMVEVDEPGVIPGHNMLRYKEIIKDME